MGCFSTACRRHPESCIHSFVLLWAPVCIPGAPPPGKQSLSVSACLHFYLNNRVCDRGQSRCRRACAEEEKEEEKEEEEGKVSRLGG